jgi:hypothetical protein
VPVKKCLASLALATITMMTALLLPMLATLTLATKKVLPHKVLPDFFYRSFIKYLLWKSKVSYKASAALPA